MNHGLRMHHHMNLRSLHPEEPLGLDNFEALVHHGGGIDGNLGAHVPVGMPERLIFGGRCNLLLFPSAERAAGSGEMNQVDGIAPRAQQALENGRMFRVHRIDGRMAALGLPHHQRTGRHQGFLVGQGDGFPRPDGGKRGPEPAEAHHGGHHHIHLGSLH